MACLFTCLLYVGLAGIIGAAGFKLYMIVTTGRHKIKKSLKGKVVVITGGSAGIGRETVRELAKHGATVHVLSRDLRKAERVIDEVKESSRNQDIHIHHVDLNDFSTIRAFAKKFLDTGSRIHLLINNAGLANAAKRVTVDGNEETTQANHLGHFLLTNLLLKRVIESAPARIINISSLAHLFVNGNKFDVHNINFEKPSNQWTGMRAYCWSKLMNVLFTRELARRLYEKGVTVNALHPGSVRTELTRAGTWKDDILLFFVKLGGPFYKSPLEGAQTTLYLATADEVEHVSGHYFSDCAPAATNLLALDDQLAEELWKESEKLTGLAK